MFTGVSGPNLWRGIRNDEAYCSVVRAFNEYLGEEYCPAFPDRFLDLASFPRLVSTPPSQSSRSVRSSVLLA